MLTIIIFVSLFLYFTWLFLRKKPPSVG